MKPSDRRSDDWVFGALLAAVLGSALGLNSAWVKEADGAHAAQPASSAPAVAKAPAPAAIVARTRMLAAVVSPPQP
jgi:hypothetical protein